MGAAPRPHLAAGSAQRTVAPPSSHAINLDSLESFAHYLPVTGGLLQPRRRTGQEDSTCNLALRRVSVATYAARARGSGSRDQRAGPLAQCTRQSAPRLRQTSPRPRVAQVVAYRGLSDQSLPLSYGALVRFLAVDEHSVVRTDANEGSLLSTTAQVPLCCLSLWTAFQLALDRGRTDLWANAIP